MPCHALRHRSEDEARADELAVLLPAGDVTAGQVALDGSASGLQTLDLVLDGQHRLGARAVLGD